SGAHKYSIGDGKLVVKTAAGETGLENPAQFVGFSGDAAAPTGILLANNGLDIEIEIDASHPTGAEDPANVKDLLLESAVTAIQDCEDSVAAVDAEDKAVAYGNWFGLMKGDLAETLEKGGRTITRTLNPDRTYTAVDGSELTLHGRVL